MEENVENRKILIKEKALQNLRKELPHYIEKAAQWHDKCTSDYLSLLEDVICGCMLVAEDNQRCREGVWHNADLCRTMLTYGEVYLQYADEEMLDFLYGAGERMLDALSDHPRLTVRLLRFLLVVTNHIEALAEQDVDLGVDFRRTLYDYEKNIRLADEGNLEQITSGGLLATDPVEWTERFEQIVDEVDKRVDEKLADCKRGMGFCHLFWWERAKAFDEAGLSWRSPCEMNPSVMFD